MNSADYRGDDRRVLGLVETAAGTFTFVSRLGPQEICASAARAAATLHSRQHRLFSGPWMLRLGDFGNGLRKARFHQWRSCRWCDPSCLTGKGGNAAFAAPGAINWLCRFGKLCRLGLLHGGTDSESLASSASPPPSAETCAGPSLGGSIAGGAADDAENYRRGHRGARFGASIKSHSPA